MKKKECTLESEQTTRSPSFYWKIATREDMGLADATCIDGYFEFVDSSPSPRGQSGILTFLLILIAKRDIDPEAVARRCWWSPFLITASIGPAASYLRRFMHKNSLTQARRRNISEHYDLSNEMLSSFMDESMTYSCARFNGRLEQSVHVLRFLYQSSD
ncbi:hypothetical protein M758_2G229200 [Ceratodon purpureus]|nr:hypothetical protein M758_2G229200 [Ceratodon purpureus]